jgi:AhpD family alkylhydroperoxidase
MNKKELDQLTRKCKRSFGQLQDWMETLLEDNPELLKHYMGIRDQVLVDGALPRKDKELILLAINMVRMYQPGIDSHLKMAVNLGATKEEIMEVIATAVLSSAAPAIRSGPRAWKADLERRKK